MTFKSFTFFTLLITLFSHMNGFVINTQQSSISFARSQAHLSAEKKGFGPTKPVEPRVKSEKQIQREQGAAKYDEISKKGGQEYNVFVRQFGTDSKSWLPCGSVAVPRGAQVADAIYANEKGLQEAIVRTFPKLRGSESEFEYGFNLKVYPDDPIEVAIKSGKKSAGFSIGNWLSTLLSPIDASEVKN